MQIVYCIDGCSLSMEAIPMLDILVMQSFKLPWTVPVMQKLYYAVVKHAYVCMGLPMPI